MDDNAAILLRCGAGTKGMIGVSQVAPEPKNGLQIRVAGDAGGLLWDQERPDDLEFTPVGKPTPTLRRGGDVVLTPARLPEVHPEGYLEAFATLYAEAAAQMREFRNGTISGRDTVLPTVSEGLAFYSDRSSVKRRGRGLGRPLRPGLERLQADHSAGPTLWFVKVHVVSKIHVKAGCCLSDS